MLRRVGKVRRTYWCGVFVYRDVILQTMTRRVKSALPHILSIETYADIEHEIPYTYQFTELGKSLTVVGVNHVHEADHPAFSLLDSVFARVPFDIVFVEGMDSDFIEPAARAFLSHLTLEAAAARGGEAVYAAVKALKLHIAWQPAEPNDDALFSYLTTLGFSKLDIVTWYLLRLVPQYIARNELVPFTLYLEPFLHEVATATKWQEASSEPAMLLEHARAVLGRDITLHNYRLAYGYTNPLSVAERDNDFCVFNTLSATADVFRDRTMVTKVLAAVAAGKRVLLVCGVAHAVMQEPAFRKYFS